MKVPGFCEILKMGTGRTKERAAILSLRLIAIH